jgi:hypothetical protein
MDDRLMSRNVDSAVFLSGGKTEEMVILVDGTANGTKAVMTVGKHIGDRELFSLE